MLIINTLAQFKQFVEHKLHFLTQKKERKYLLLTVRASNTSAIKAGYKYVADYS